MSPYKRTGKPPGRPRVEIGKAAPLARRATFDRDTVETIMAGLGNGMSFRDASEHAGMPWSTFRERLESDPEFARSMRAGRLRAKGAALEVIFQAARDGMWGAAAWWLSKAHRDDYGSSSSVIIEPPAPPEPFPELAIAAKIRASDEAMRLMHESIAVSVAEWERERKKNSG